MHENNELYERLGLTSDATAEEIKKAYRKKAMQNHPDRKGGNKEKFFPIVEAYDVLSDPKKKRIYDASGRVETEQEENVRLIRDLSSILIATIEGVRNIDTMNVIELMRITITKRKNANLESLVGAQKDLKRFKTAKKRLKKKKSGPNKLMKVVDAHIRDIEESITLLKEEIEYKDKMTAALKDYDYECEIFREESAEEESESLKPRRLAYEGLRPPAQNNAIHTDNEEADKVDKLFGDTD